MELPVFMILQLSSTGPVFTWTYKSQTVSETYREKGTKKYFVFLTDSSGNSTWTAAAKLSFTLLNLITHIEASADELRYHHHTHPCT